MKIGLVTTWNEACGVAEYSKNLVNNSAMEFDIYNRDRWNVDTLMGGDFQIMHVTYEPGLFEWLTLEHLRSIRDRGKKLVLTLHTSHAGNNRSGFTDCFHKVIVHEHTQDGFTYIPHGIVVMPKDEDEGKDFAYDVGTVGFPFPWKGMGTLSRATGELGLSCLLVMPESRHWEVEPARVDALQANPKATVITKYMPVEDIQENLFSNCAVTAFLYEGGNLGISGAVRVGIGARRPVIVTINRQFRDLEDYKDEIYVTDGSMENIKTVIQEALQTRRVPNRLLEDMNWTRTAHLYDDVYKELS